MFFDLEAALLVSYAPPSRRVYVWKTVSRFPF